tara:strand:- start:1787 stop:2773 length:987 start_codon:yes stop_codon:yes gene_type:complete
LQVRAAFDVLKDPMARSKYDYSYASVKLAWQWYRAELANFRRHSKSEQCSADEHRLEAERERKRKEFEAAVDREICKAQEAKRKAAEVKHKADEAQRRAEAQAQAAQQEKARQERERLAERRTREAAERAQREREEAARQRLRKLRELAAEARSAKVVERARLEQTEKAQERLAQWELEQEAQREAERARERSTIIYQHPLHKEDWISAREQAAKRRPKEHTRSMRSASEKAAKIRAAKRWAEILHNKYVEGMSAAGYVLPQDGEYVELGWEKMAGVAVCDFCDKPIKLCSFTCPSGGAVACDWCKTKMSFYLPPLPSAENWSGRWRV